MYFSIFKYYLTAVQNHKDIGKERINLNVEKAENPRYSKQSRQGKPTSDPNPVIKYFQLHYI